jgi:hypothetical protein
MHTSMHPVEGKLLSAPSLGILKKGNKGTTRVFIGV